MAEHVCNQDYSHNEKRQPFLPIEQGGPDFIEIGLALIVHCQNCKKRCQNL